MYALICCLPTLGVPFPSVPARALFYNTLFKSIVLGEWKHSSFWKQSQTGTLCAPERTFWSFCQRGICKHHPPTFSEARAWERCCQNKSWLLLSLSPWKLDAQRGPVSHFFSISMKLFSFKFLENAKSESWTLAVFIRCFPTYLLAFFKKSTKLLWPKTILFTLSFD